MMRGTRIVGTTVLWLAIAAAPLTAQTVTSIAPPVLGQSIARATVRINVTNGLISDGLKITVSNDSFAAAHQGSWAFEFNTSGGLIDPGAVEVVPPNANAYDAFAALEGVINANASLPFRARFFPEVGWFVLMWKYDREWGLNTTAPTGLLAAESGDTSGVVTFPGNPNPPVSNFAKNNTDNGPVFLQIRGSNLSGLNNSSGVKLRHQVNTSELYNGVITVKHANSATVSFKTLNVGTGSPPAFPSLGVYQLEVNGTATGHTVTLVENLLDDPTARVHSSGSAVAFQWFGEDLMPGAHWMSNPYPGADIRDNGSANRQLCPRLYPFPTGLEKHVGNNINDVDNENLSLQWTTAAGVRRGWQTVPVNFASDTTLRLTGLWAATGDHYAMSYGAQLRAGDENGTIIAQTPPGQRVITPFGWTDFAVSGVIPAGTTQVTVVFYGEHPGTGEKALHVDNLLLQVDADHPAPPAITGMTSPSYATIGNTQATVTLTGANLASGQTSVTLREPDVMIADRLSWADLGKKLVHGGGETEAPFGAYVFGPGDKIVLTAGANVILGEYEIAAKDDDRVITLVEDINGATQDEGSTITGYIVKAPLAATAVNATGTQVSATFDLTGVPAGYRNIIVQTGTHDPVVWREGLNVVNAGSSLINGSFELPEAPQDCGGSRTETRTAASDWNVRFWNNFLERQEPIVSFRDDFWALPGSGTVMPSCPPAERGDHYASTVIYNGEGTAQWSQTLTTEPGKKYALSGYFGHSGEFGVHGTEITLSLLDGDNTAAPMAGATTLVLTSANFEDWTFGAVTGTATGEIFTVAWEIKCFGPETGGPRAVWIDHLVLVESCNSPFADADDDGDVDQVDFAFYQACTDAGGTLPLTENYCFCFDVNADGHIDDGDFAAFQHCASGPEVPADPLCGN